jgi:predicted RNA-binding Zn-ribbon protein involved in translation (DUF1610 family)
MRDFIFTFLPCHLDDVAFPLHQDHRNGICDPSSPRETAMEHLIFTCPTTGREIESGVESEIGTLLRIREQHVRVHCPACGDRHEWPVRDAFLARTAAPMPGAIRHIA